MVAIALCVVFLCALLRMETGELDQLDKLIERLLPLPPNYRRHCRHVHRTSLSVFVANNCDQHHRFQRHAHRFHTFIRRQENTHRRFTPCKTHSVPKSTNTYNDAFRNANTKQCSQIDKECSRTVGLRQSNDSFLKVFAGFH